MGYSLHWSEQEKETPASDNEEKTETPTKVVRSPRTNDRLHSYPFWTVLMAAGVAVSAAGFYRKKSGLKNQE